MAGCFLLNSWLSYRALFNWGNPIGYLSTLILVPVSLGFIVAMTAGGASQAIGSAVWSAHLATAVAVIYGITMAVVNERIFGTLELGWLCAPQTTLGSLLCKSLLHILQRHSSRDRHVPGHRPVTARSGPATRTDRHGCFIAYGGGIRCLPGNRPRIHRDPFRDALTLPSIAYALIMMGSGGLGRAAVLPVEVRWLHLVLPTGYAAVADISAITGGGMDWPGLGAELLTGVVWGLIGYVALCRALSVARQRSRLDLR